MSTLTSKDLLSSFLRSLPLAISILFGSALGALYFHQSFFSPPRLIFAFGGALLFILYATCLRLFVIRRRRTR